MRRIAFLLAAAALLLATPVRATVYSWRDGDGAYHFTNQAEEVPQGQQLEAYRTFTEPAATRAADGAPADPPGDAAADPPGGYEQGFAAGLRMGEEQIRMAGELARTIAEPAASSVAAPIVYAPPAAPVIVEVTQAADGGCGGWGGCGPYGYGYGWAPWFVGPAFFGGPFARHGHFGHFDHHFGGHGFGHGGLSHAGFGPGFGGFAGGRR